ncbi:hypothetical protein [Streptantibioticus ferralitis]|uniref:Uncharacterized protein n=1 Tax=Streptantibioticus ferralitis TaxID=236510 RepID=A0ABT5Z425_9ACTN|nr:hypothetical protein [Streptantibioticus ferralitis]MDF2258582.1 hypothetical protein [Streptantibioticus ferralitis]
MRLRMNGASVDGTLADGATTYPSSADRLWKPDPNSENLFFMLEREHENFSFGMNVELQDREPVRSSGSAPRGLGGPWEVSESPWQCPH